MSSFEGASETENCFWESFCSLKTAQKKQENLKGRFHVLMHEVFLTEVFYRKVESNRIDFPKQIRIKRKYLEVVRR